MRRKLICIISLALVIALGGGDALSAKRSRSAKKSPRVTVKKKQNKSGRTVKRGKSVARSTKRRGGKRGRVVARSRRKSDTVAAEPVATTPRVVQTGIPTERVTEIQNSLIKLGYLEGPASGQYDEMTIQAMKQFQKENKLPDTGMPSAHSLKRLGVSKRNNDGYAVPVKNLSEGGKKNRDE
jgi:peptidoglycan hydrolase-like protein with peptidoglycan-binding domain